MTINKQDYELLKPLLDDPNKHIVVDVPILPEEFNRMARLLNDRLIKITQDFGNSSHYGLTERGEEEVRNFEANAVDEMIDEADVNKYPALFENKSTGCVILAINPTCGTIVKEALLNSHWHNIRCTSAHSKPVSNRSSMKPFGSAWVL